MQKYIFREGEAAANESSAREFVATSLRGRGTANAYAIRDCEMVNTQECLNHDFDKIKKMNRMNSVQRHS